VECKWAPSQFAVVVSFARVDGSRIHDWASFHDEFNRTFAFPDFYGRNMDAWIDCMSSLDEPSAQLTGIHCERGKVLNAVKPTAEKAGASFMDARRGSL